MSLADPPSPLPGVCGGLLAHLILIKSRLDAMSRQSKPG